MLGIIRAVVVPSMPDPEKLTAVRAAIPGLGAGIYLDTGLAGPIPAETAAAMAQIHEHDRDLGRGHPGRVEELATRMDEARAGVAAVLGTDVDAVALTHSATDAMVAACLLPDWRRGDRIVTLARAGPSVRGVLYAVRDRTGAELAFVDAGDDGDDARTLAAFDAAIVPGTRLVSIDHVLRTTGAVLPIAAIARLAHDRGASIVVDGTQAVGAIPFRFDALGVDAYAVSAAHWLLGPEAMGALVIDRATMGGLLPALAGPAGLEPSDGEPAGHWRPDARRFEWSEFELAAVVGMARSIGWLSMYVGLEFVYRRGAAMARLAAERLARIPGVRVLTPPGSMATLVSFAIAGWPAQTALDELGARAFVIASAIPVPEAIRISPACFTTDGELDRLVEAVALLAAHSPATIPARRTLSLLGDR